MGNVLDIILKFLEDFDLVFIDVDKSNYLNYFELLLLKFKLGVVILSDNVFWSGKVIDKVKEDDIDIKVLLCYNKMLNENL